MATRPQTENDESQLASLSVFCEGRRSKVLERRNICREGTNLDMLCFYIFVVRRPPAITAKTPGWRERSASFALGRLLHVYMFKVCMYMHIYIYRYTRVYV